MVTGIQQSLGTVIKVAGLLRASQCGHHRALSLTVVPDHKQTHRRVQAVAVYVHDGICNECRKKSNVHDAVMYNMYMCTSTCIWMCM